jgi:hypothetical protein
MADVREFKRPEKQPTDCLLVTLLISELPAGAREIYFRIIRESPPGVLLTVDRLAVEVAARCVHLGLTIPGGDEWENSIREIFETLLLPKLGQEYIDQVASL